MEDQFLSVPTNSKIVSVSFRNKGNGWKTYNVEIIISETND